MKWYSLTLCALGGVAGLAQAQDDIVIGQSVPLSGPSADIGRDMRDGAAAYFRYHAKLHPNAPVIRLVSLDNANDKDRALENTKVLLDQHQALALFGYNSATVSVEPYTLAQQQGLLFFAPFSGSNVLRNQPNFYSMRASYETEAAKIVENRRIVGATKAVVVHYDDAVGRSNFESVAKAFADQKLPAPRGVAIPRKQDIEAKVLDQVLSDAPHYVISTVSHKPAGDLLKAANAQGRPLSLAALSFVNPDEFAASAGDVARGTVISQVVPSPTAGNAVSMPVINECTEALKAQDDLKPNYTLLESCLAAKTLTLAIKKAGPNPTRASVLKAMGQLGKVDLGGFKLDYSNGQHHGGQYVELTILGRGNRFVR